MFDVDPDLLTIFAYVVPVPAELKHIVPGVINCIWLPVVITSDRTPEPGKGSTFIPLDASLVLAAVSEYYVTHAA